MTGYTKLFGSIIASSVWRESKETKIVWITMLAMAKKTGVVEASLPGLAVLAGVTLDECQAAIARLSEADPYSRTKDNEGRRIACVDGGWHILNHAKYRAKMSNDERREYLKIKQREFRAKQKGVNTESTINSMSTHTKAEAEADTEADNPPMEPFDVWLRNISRMYPSNWITIKAELKLKLSRARSPEAKAEWRRRLAVIEEKLLGPPVNDPQPTTAQEPVGPPVPESEWKSGMDTLKATVAAAIPPQPIKPVLRKLRFKRPELPPTP